MVYCQTVTVVLICPTALKCSAMNQHTLIKGLHQHEMVQI